MDLPVYDRSGNQVGTIQIDPADFGGAVNKQLLHDVVVMYQCNSRQGTVQTKNRAAVAGSGRKMYRQKGTGNARMGDKRTGKRRGGGMAHRKLPRDYSYTMPRRMVRTATRMALLSKFLDDEAKVIDQLSFDEPKTKDMARVLEALGLDGQSCLIATTAHDPNVWLSARNIDRVGVLPARDLNALELLRHKRLLITRDAINALKPQTAATPEATS
jgi:large subunit ribosomal protein L4